MCHPCSEYLRWIVHGSHSISVSQAALASFDTFITAVCSLTTSKEKHWLLFYVKRVTVVHGWIVLCIIQLQ